MKNPYDIYNDNRAYHGYKRGVLEALDEFSKRYTDCDPYINCDSNEVEGITCVECISKRIKDELNEK